MIVLGHLWTLYCTETEKWIHFLTERCKNYQLYRKIVQIKVVENWILYKKVNGRICLSFPGVKLGASKDCHLLNIITYWNKKVNSFSGWTLPKLRNITRNASNKSCWALNFVQECQQANMSIFLKSGAMGLERLICFKYYIVLKWESRFTSGLNASKTTHYI